jgi:enamine deaminase RidA (YjgF/YER057c/UK114 family)
MFRILCVIPLFLLATACTPTRQETRKDCFHLSEKIEKEIGYCQAIRTGNSLHISGSVGAGDMPDAMRHAYDEIRKTLAAHGLDFHNVTKENVYATDLDAFIRNKDIRKEYYGTDFPSATWVQVQRLYLPTFVVEIEVTADIAR